MAFVIKYTKKIRYKTAEYILRTITPYLYKSIDKESFKINNTHLFPRPSIVFIKNRFKDKCLIGLELGVKKGINAYSILNNLNINTLYLVDNWKNYEFVPKNAYLNYQFVKKTFKNDIRIKIIKGNSLNVCKNFNSLLDFIYIDADHSYKGVYNDILNWIDKVKSNGVISGHDIRYNLPYTPKFDVYSAVSDFCYDYGYTFYINKPDWYFIKK